MTAEHEKNEYSATYKKIDFEGMKTSFGADFKQAIIAMQNLDLNNTTDNAVGIITPTEKTGDKPNSISPLLEMTDQGIVFKSGRSEEENLALKQKETETKLLQSLLDAISRINGKAPTKSNCNTPNCNLEANNIKNAISNGMENQQLELPSRTLEVNLNITETRSEYERTDFSSSGQITTADGKNIQFDMKLKMEREYKVTREYQATEKITFRDPLVVNFDGESADLENKKFTFDLDADGQDEMISYLTGSSGMLALDKNKDGKINNGKELFGTISGDGFADLAKYDEDKNNYIDEADSIFKDLKIWKKLPDSEELISMADANIGAIYLGNSKTEFDIKGEGNQQNGKIKSTGLYIGEDGKTNTIQQVDMAV